MFSYICCIAIRQNSDGFVRSVELLIMLVASDGCSAGTDEYRATLQTGFAHHIYIVAVLRQSRSVQAQL